MSYRYIVGDIHGTVELLKKLLDKIDKELNAHDKLIFLGDYIDRGKNSKQTIELLLQFHNSYPEQVVFLKGNHEDWLLNTYHNYSIHSWLLGMEGCTTIKSYSKQAAKVLEKEIRKFGMKLIYYKKKKKAPALPYDIFFNSMPPDHISFFEQLRLYYEDEGIICSHAGLEIGMPLASQAENELLWSNTHSFIERWKGPKVLVLGHVHTYKIIADMYGKVIIKDKVIFTDTGCPQTGILSAVRFPDGHVIQAVGRHQL